MYVCVPVGKQEKIPYGGAHDGVSLKKKAKVK